MLKVWPAEILNEESISAGLEDAHAKDWAESVCQRDIIDKAATLYLSGE
jgi:hypothetical protein